MAIDAMRLSPDQLKQMTSSLGIADAGGAMPDKRVSPRMQLGTRATIVPCGEKAARRPFTVTVLNISDTGVAIQNPPALKPRRPVCPSACRP